ncbi:MAG: extracellular solute-binding protein [Patescibacteria group bacterium]|jgi:ABC-type glycerol-3-phosphate transport system substrate-binding protein
MKRFLKFASYAVMMAFFTVALSGCTKKTSTTDARATKVIVWSFEDPDVWKPIVKDFESTNKGYTMEYVQQTLDAAYENKVLNSQLSGTGPDVWSMPNDWVYRHKDKLVPAPTAITSKVNMDEGYVQSIKQSVQIDNNIYALSASAEPMIVYYNPSLIRQALSDLEKSTVSGVTYERISKMFDPVPNTWTNFAEAMPYLTKRDGDNISIAGAAIGSDNVSYPQDILYLLMLQNETKILSDDLKLAMFSLPSSTPVGTEEVPGKRALEFYTSFANPKGANYTWNESMGNDVEAFVNGKVAILFGYDRLLNVFAQKYPTFKDYATTYVPQVNTEPDKIIDYARFNAFGVSAITPNSAIAWNVVHGLATTYSSNITSASRLYGSYKYDSYEIGIENRTGNNPEKLELATAKAFQKGRYPGDFDANMRNAIRAVNKGTLTAQAALNQAADNITVLLRKETW